MRKAIDGARAWRAWAWRAGSGARRGVRSVAAAGALLLLLGAGGLGSGCRNVESVTIPNVFRTMPERPLADVPVPVGFRLRHRGSYVFNDNYRVARLYYTGTVSKSEIEQFYKDQMPLSRWTLVRDSGEDERAIEFRNDEETCTVTFNRRGGVSTVDIVVEPRAAPGTAPATIAPAGFEPAARGAEAASLGGGAPPG